jgi:TRAP-type C4-dicarboxylate transport system substrate-binding protein
MREAVTAAVLFQRDLGVVEDKEARAAIEAEGYEIIELTVDQHDAFAAAIGPIYADARRLYPPKTLNLLPRPI